MLKRRITVNESEKNSEKESKNKKRELLKLSFDWWCYLIFERKVGICPLLLGYFANDLYVKIVLVIVKNAPFQNIS